VIACHLGAVVVADPHRSFRARRIKAEPGAGRRRDGEHGGYDSAAVKFLDRLLPCPADLICEVRNLARVLPIEPGLPIVRRIEMMVGIDHPGSAALRMHFAARRQSRRGKRGGSAENMATG
jgi:hypothetical protein